MGNHNVMPDVQAVREHLYSKDLPIRERAAEVLGRTKSIEAVLALLAALKSQNRYVATRAAWGLSLISAEVVLPYLAQALDTPQEAVVELVAWALGRMGRAARQVLVVALEHRCPFVRRAAGAGLWQHAVRGYKSKKVEQLLSGMLQGDRGHVALTLRHMREQRLAPKGTPSSAIFFDRMGGKFIR
ncbi:MAG TPA: hypothetical protein DCZ01_03725 [Elusimicrobia bacterium]|nr:MAG: hypothetical protein A2X37_05980 [Elusimicrobia bacterium GWA2_66_18]OGR70629.1 MAG: hypothetical protein A2X40_07660 [Elusimicrobia bacterium GWC2_65_9]HAZ07637.1 hypothetical protein [Elusimicrobiota bacterium]